MARLIEVVEQRGGVGSGDIANFSSRCWGRMWLMA
jgi:hypothetical protein